MITTPAESVDWSDVAVHVALVLAVLLIVRNVFVLVRSLRPPRPSHRRYELTSREWIRRTPTRAPGDVDPIAELVTAFALGNKPSLGWVIRWSEGGRVEPVLAAWRNTTDVFAMKQLLHLAGHDLSAIEIRFRAAALENRDEMLPDALRRVIATPPTLRELLARRVDPPVP